MIFEDNFDYLDFEKWQHENTLAGGGVSILTDLKLLEICIKTYTRLAQNWEFQWYGNNRSNSYCHNGNVVLKPTLTSDKTGEQFMSSGVLNIHGGSPADA